LRKVTPPTHTVFYSRLLDRYLKTTCTVFPYSRIFPSRLAPSQVYMYIYRGLELSGRYYFPDYTFILLHYIDHRLLLSFL
jgi:hypothetical protein